MVQILLKEEVFTMDSLVDCLDLDGGQYLKTPFLDTASSFVLAGGFIGNLGESKKLYLRLSALAKKAAKLWQAKLLESQAWGWERAY